MGVREEKQFKWSFVQPQSATFCKSYSQVKDVGAVALSPPADFERLINFAQ